MIIEERTPLLPSKRIELKLQTNVYTLDTFALKNGVQVVLHLNNEDNKITLSSKKLINAHFTNKSDWTNFMKDLSSLFTNHKNTRSIMLALAKQPNENIWLNPNYTFDSNSNNNQNKKNNQSVNFNEVNILALISEDAQGQSILSKIGIIEPFSEFKESGREVKCKIRFNSNEFHFTVNRNTNQFSTWKKGFGGGGAQQFLQKAIGFTAKKSIAILNDISKTNDLSKLIIKNNSFEFKNSTPTPIPSKKQDDFSQIISYFERVRGISPQITQELIGKGAVKFATMIRTSKHTYDDTLKTKKGTDETISINFPKAGIKNRQIYFPLFDIKNKEKSIQFLDVDEKKSKAKMNQGTTYGVYSGFKNKNANNYILSEAAFDNYALYEMSKSKINTDLYNFFSCQSVGGIETWIESNFGFSFHSEKNSNVFEIKKNMKTKEIVDLNETYLIKLKKELLGSENQDSRKIVLVYNPTDTKTIEKLKIIESSMKNIDQNIQIEWLESKNRYVKFFDYKPLDIILDSSSIDSWIERNEFTIKNGYLQKEKITKELLPLTDKDFAFMAKKNINSLISATDNDLAGHLAREKIRLFCSTFNIKFADWSPTEPKIKDHNDCLKLSKGIPVFIADDNDKDKKIKVLPSEFDLTTLFNYIDESKIKHIAQQKNKKKIEHKVK